MKITVWCMLNSGGKKKIGIKVYLENMFDYEVHLLGFFTFCKSSIISALKLVFPAKIFGKIIIYQKSFCTF